MKTIVLLIGVLFFIHNSMTLCAQSEYNFTTQKEIDDFGENFPQIKQIGGNIWIHGKGIYYLKGLKNIESIDGSISISGCSIETFEGLENLEYIGGSLWVWLCGNIKNFKGFDKLKEVGYLHVEYNLSQENFVGLEKLEKIGYGTIGYCGSQAFAPSNPMLTSLDGLQGLRHVDDYLSINFCEVLTDISAIYHLQTVGGNLNVIGNISLESCNLDSLCLIDCPGINISRNGEACSYADPIPSCAQQISVETENNHSSFTVYYDPVSRTIRINGLQNSDLKTISIYSINGKPLQSAEFMNSEIDVSSLPPGVYVTEIEQQEDCFRNKISIY